MKAENSCMVLQLPNSCTEPVQQTRRGRYPKTVSRLRDARAKRDLAHLNEQKRRDRIEFLKESWHCAVAYKERVEGEPYSLGGKPPIETISRL